MGQARRVPLGGVDVAGGGAEGLAHGHRPRAHTNLEEIGAGAARAQGPRQRRAHRQDGGGGEAQAEEAANGHGVGSHQRRRLTFFTSRKSGASMKMR